MYWNGVSWILEDQNTEKQYIRPSPIMVSMIMLKFAKFTGNVYRGKNETNSGVDRGFSNRGGAILWARSTKSPRAGVRPAKLFIPLQFRTPVRTHLHTANQRPRVLICIQPIHRGWFNPRYKLVYRPPLLPSTARCAVGKATCSTALHCLFSGCEFKSSCWLFCCCYNKMGNNGVYSVRGDTQMMK